MVLSDENAASVRQPLIWGSSVNRASALSAARLSRFRLLYLLNRARNHSSAETAPISRAM
eukprot:5708611-Pleurochrysis_carterae.AAC.2